MIGVLVKIELDIDDEVIADPGKFAWAVGDAANIIKVARRLGWLDSLKYTSKVRGFSIKVESCQQSVSAVKSNETSS